MLRIRNFFAVLLAVCMLLSVVPAYAQSETTVVLDEEWESDLFRREEHDSQLGSGPVLSEGNHVDWIDRIGSLPAFAVNFYSWLEENAAVGGALVDPSLAESFSSTKSYLLTTVTGSTTFTYTSGANLSELAYQAAKADLGNTSNYISSYAFATYGAFDRDHPEVFWLTGGSKCGSSISYSYSRLSGNKAVSNYTMNVYFYLTADGFDIRAAEYRDADTLALAISQRDADVERILAGAPAEGTNYDLALYFNDTLTSANAYNSYVAAGNLGSAADSAWECVSALSGKSGIDGPVCEGYARAFKVLCDRAEIPCVLVEGLGEGGDHMWNYIQLEGSWYGVDVTWNDPVVSGMEDQKVSGYESRAWFGLGSSTVTSHGTPFGETHVVENTVSANSLNYLNGPVLAENAYEPSVAMDIAPYRGGDSYTAPVKDGYVFAGWYLDAELTQPLPKDQTTGSAYPKFLLEQTLTVKIQTTNGTTADSAVTDLRLLTSVADLDLRRVEFSISIGSSTQTVSSSTVYSQVKSGDTLISNASGIFSQDSAYFVTYTLLGIPQTVFETTWTVIPSWETLDGTVVAGTARNFSISETY